MSERSAEILEETKAAVGEIERDNKDYERLWRKEVESIPQFIPIRARAPERDQGAVTNRLPQQVMDTGPKPLTFREPTPLLALPVPGTEGRLEGVE